MKMEPTKRKLLVENTSQFNPELLVDESFAKYLVENAEYTVIAAYAKGKLTTEKAKKILLQATQTPKT